MWHLKNIEEKNREEGWIIKWVGEDGENNTELKSFFVCKKKIFLYKYTFSISFIGDKFKNAMSSLLPRGVSKLGPGGGQAGNHGAQ